MIRRLPVSTAALVVALLIVICGVGAVTYLLADSHERIAATASNDARQRAVSLEREMVRNVDLLDLSIQSVVDGLNQPAVMALPPLLRNEMLFSRAAAARYIRNVSIVNASGQVMADSLSKKQAVADLSLRPILRLTQTQGPSGIFIGYPYLGNDGISHFVDFARPIWSPKNAKLGYVVATVNLTNFSDILNSFHVPPGSVLKLSRDDGEDLIKLDELPDHAISANSLPQRVSLAYETALRAATSSPPSAGFTYRQDVPGTPLVVTASLSDSTVFANWREQSGYVLIYCAATSVLLLILTLWLGHNLRLRAKSEAMLAQMANLDPLTGVFNRRALNDAYSRETALTGDRQLPSCVLFIDVDHFKLFNDSYGHLAGDLALVSVATAIRQCAARRSDLVARYGGEEFVAILADTAISDGMRIAENIRAAVRALNIPNSAAESGLLTVSLGVATLCTHQGLPHGDALRRADEALYVAKQTGRDRVIYLDLTDDLARQNA